MTLKENKHRFSNYDAHITTIAHNPKSAHASENIILANNGKFNPNGGWLTPNAMRRWVNLYVTQAGKSRIYHWVDQCAATALANKLSHDNA